MSNLDKEKYDYFKPQPGKQTDFLASKADIVVYGGGAGSGKTHALLLEAIRYQHVPGSRVGIFRNTLTQVTQPGGLWDTAKQIYPELGGVTSGRDEFIFPSGSRITFSYLRTEDDLNKYKGAQFSCLMFDELTHFNEHAFFYMLSRLRSTTGIDPYVRATTNPDKTHWLRKFIDWYIGEDGIPIEERSGVVRYFIKKGNDVFWYDDEMAAILDHPGIKPKSFTFISARVQDNPALLDIDPSYLANLHALPELERQQLLLGNWDAQMARGNFFKKENFAVVQVPPVFPKGNVVRCWDWAATDPGKGNDPDWTVGMKMGRDELGTFYILDLVRFRKDPHEVKPSFLNTTHQDGKDVHIHIPIDPGAAGKIIADDFVRAAAGYTITAERVTGAKTLRATPASSQAAAGNIKIVEAGWNKVLLDELEDFPVRGHDDIVDTLTDCIQALTKKKTRDWAKFIQ